MCCPPDTCKDLEFPASTSGGRWWLPTGPRVAILFLGPYALVGVRQLLYKHIAVAVPQPNKTASSQERRPPFPAALHPPQVSFLHVYHHMSINAVVGLSLPYAWAGDMYLPIVLNAFVHVLLYTHYFLTGLGIRSWWARHLTNLQVCATIMRVFSSEKQNPRLTPRVELEGRPLSDNGFKARDVSVRRKQLPFIFLHCI